MEALGKNLSAQAVPAYLEPRDSAGYYGELNTTGDPYPGWTCWFVSMISSCYTAHELLAGIASATAQESDPEIRGKIKTIQAARRRRRLDNAESTEDLSPSWICWSVAMVLASYISYELLSEGSRRISDESPGGQGSYAEAEDGASAQGSLELDFESPFSLRGADASSLAEDPAQVFNGNLILDAAKRTIESFLAEDPAKGLALSVPEVNAYKFQSGDVVETSKKLLLRCRTHVCGALCVPPQPRGDVANVTIDVCGRQGRDGQESLESLGATP